MTDKYPPLPELEIQESTKRNTDQQTVDRALRTIYNLRPDLFAKLAEKERENAHLGEYGDEFLLILRDEFTKRNNLPGNIVAPYIMLEATRRARLMYGIPLKPLIDLDVIPREIQILSK